MAPSKTPGQKNAASETFLKRDAQKHGLGVDNAPAHKEGHAPGEAPVAGDSGITESGVENVSRNIPGERSIANEIAKEVVGNP